MRPFFWFSAIDLQAALGYRKRGNLAGAVKHHDDGIGADLLVPLQMRASRPDRTGRTCRKE